MFAPLFSHRLGMIAFWSLVFMYLWTGAHHLLWTPIPDLGCALAGGTDIAVEAANLVLPRNRLGDLGPALTLSRRALRIIQENLFWTFTYNLVTLPLAASGHLAPVYAAAAMAVSSTLVVANSLRLSRIRPRQKQETKLEICTCRYW